MREKLITVVLTIILIASPIAIIPDANNYNIPKTWILLICGAVLLILLLLNYKKLKLDKKDYVILAFAGIIFISTMCSSDIMVSILGDKNRYEGMLALYSYIVIYFCAKKFFKYNNKNTLLNVLHIVYILIGILGILQHYIILTKWKLFPIFNNNVCGTFGNTNFMGNFICIGLPIFMLSYILKGNKISLTTSLITFFCLIACTARSGWVAFILFCLGLGVYLIKNWKKEYIKKILVLILGFVMIFIAIYSIKIYITIPFESVNIQSTNVLKNKINTISKDFQIAKTEGMKGSLGSGRIAIWKITLELIQKYHLLGVGTDNLQKGIAENLTETSLEFITAAKAVPDKAHNEYLQIAATLGIPALLIYLIFICSILMPKLKYMLKEEKMFCLGSVIISYLVQAFFNISTIGIAPLFWIALGLIDNKWLTKETNKEEMYERKSYE